MEMDGRGDVEGERKDCREASGGDDWYGAQSDIALQVIWKCVFCDESCEWSKRM